MSRASRIRFAVMGANHCHVDGMIAALTAGGGVLESYFIEEWEIAAHFAQRHPQAWQARSPAEILENDGVQLVVSAAVPRQRAKLGVAAMRHGKDFFCAKPAFTTLDDLEQARDVQRRTGRIFSVFFSERLAQPAAVEASRLVRFGAIGLVVHFTGLGPHRLSLLRPAIADLPSAGESQMEGHGRPGWFFNPTENGGILADLGAHQIDQFLHFTGSEHVEVLAARVANHRHPHHGPWRDVGEAMLGGDHATGYFRCDWLSPRGLDVWGDSRTFLLGTEGYIEIRANTDLGGAGGSHLFLVDADGVRHLDCSALPCPFGGQLIDDVLQRTETALPQAHCFRVSECALKAQAIADGLTYHPRTMPSQCSLQER